MSRELYSDLKDCFVYKVTYFTEGKESDSYVVPYLFRHAYHIDSIGYGTCNKILNLKDDQLIDVWPRTKNVVDMYELKANGEASQVLRVKAIRIKKALGHTIDELKKIVGLRKVEEKDDEERRPEQA